MAKKGKKYQDALKQIDANKVYTAEEAVELAIKKLTSLNSMQLLK